MTAPNPSAPPPPSKRRRCYRSVANAIAGAFVSPNFDANAEPANLVDTTNEIAQGVFALAAAGQADAVEPLVGLLSDRTPSKLEIAK